MLPSKGKPSVKLPKGAGSRLVLPAFSRINPRCWENERTVLDRMQEFERTFEQNYGRKMTDEEQRILKAAREIIQQKLGAYSERAA